MINSISGFCGTQRDLLISKGIGDTRFSPQLPVLTVGASLQRRSMVRGKEKSFLDLSKQAILPPPFFPSMFFALQEKLAVFPPTDLVVGLQKILSTQLGAFALEGESFPEEIKDRLDKALLLLEIAQKTQDLRVQKDKIPVQE